MLECETLEQSIGTIGNLRPGLSLLDLMKLYNRNEFLNCLPTAVPKSYAKRPICGTNPIAAKELRRLLDGSVRQRKGAIRCYYLTEFGTFYLPSEVRDLPASVQSIMRRDICDVGVQEGWLI